MIKIEPLIKEAASINIFKTNENWLELGWGVVEGPTAAATSSATILSRGF